MKNKNDNFEENLNNLEKIVRELENGEVPLNEAIDKFNEGMKLANTCTKILDNATETVTKALNREEKLENFEINE